MIKFRSIDFEQFDYKTALDVVVFDSWYEYNVWLRCELGRWLLEHIKDSFDHLVGVHALLHDYGIARPMHNWGIGSPLWGADHNHLRKWSIFAYIPRKSSNICLSNDHGGVQIESTTNCTIGHRLTLWHWFLRVLKHIEEVLLVRKVLLCWDTDVTHSHESLKGVLAYWDFSIKQETVWAVNYSSMDVWNFSSWREGIEHHGV